jgi:hypothetical protein
MLMMKKPMDSIGPVAIIHPKAQNPNIVDDGALSNINLVLNKALSRNLHEKKPVSVH